MFDLYCCQSIFEAKKSDKIVVVLFTAVWCSTCESVQRKLGELSESLVDASFLQVDVDDCEDTATAANILRLPTVVVYKNGQALKSIQGDDKIAVEEMVRSAYEKA